MTAATGAPTKHDGNSGTFWAGRQEVDESCLPRAKPLQEWSGRGRPREQTHRPLAWQPFRIEVTRAGPRAHASATVVIPGRQGCSPRTLLWRSLHAEAGGRLVLSQSGALEGRRWGICPWDAEPFGAGTSLQGCLFQAPGICHTRNNVFHLPRAERDEGPHGADPEAHKESVSTLKMPGDLQPKIPTSGRQEGPQARSHCAHGPSCLSSIGRKASPFCSLPCGGSLTGGERKLTDKHLPRKAGG